MTATVTVRVTERPDAEALHAALDALGRNSVRWPRSLPGDVEVTIDSADRAAVRAAVQGTAPTPTESAASRRRRRIIEDLSKADLVRAILDPVAREALRARLL